MVTLSSILKRHEQSQIIKCRDKHIRALFDKAYLTAVELFPKNNLGHNLELAGITVSRIFEIPYEKGATRSLSRETKWAKMITKR